MSSRNILKAKSFSILQTQMHIIIDPSNIKMKNEILNYNETATQKLKLIEYDIKKVIDIIPTRWYVMIVNGYKWLHPNFIKQAKQRYREVKKSEAEHFIYQDTEWDKIKVWWKSFDEFWYNIVSWMSVFIGQDIKKLMTWF